MNKILLVSLILLLTTGCKVYYAPSGKAFPRSWGKPPEIQTADHIPLPYGYGYGSSTLYGWIMKNKHDVQKRINDLPDVIKK